MCDKCRAAAQSGTVLISERKVYFGVLGEAFLETFLDLKMDDSFVLNSTIISAGNGDGYADVEAEIKYCPFCGAKLSEVIEC